MLEVILEFFGEFLLQLFVGHWRARRGHDVLRIDRFAYGYLFALFLALVRYVYAH